MDEAERAVLVRRWRRELAEALTEQAQADESAGCPRMSTADQRVYARRLVNERFARHAAERLAEGLPPLAAAEEARLGQAVLDALFGLGVLEGLLADETIETVNANGAAEVWLVHADGSKRRGPAIAASDAELIEMIRTAAARLGLSERRFDPGCPALNLELPDGSRLFAVMAVTDRPCLSIRRHRHRQVDLDDLVALGTLDRGLAEFLSAAVRARKNLIVCGGTSAGKTTLLRGLLNEVPAGDRLLTIEDSFELGIDRHPELHPDAVALQTREPNVEGAGEVTMAALVRMGLRMSPDRVIVGEVRGAEVLPMLNAMSQGNDGSMCTVHAHSSAGAFARLAMYAVQSPERLPLEATALLVANAVDFVVFIAQDGAEGTGRADGVRRRRWVASVREVIAADGPLVTSNEVFAKGPGRRAVPAAPLRHDTLADLLDAGMDPAAVTRGQGERG